MKRRFFGTDGIRGKTGQHPITPDFFVKLGFAAGKVLTENHKSKVNPSVVIGKDTRISGYMFESALEAGFSAAGVDTYLTGPLPTPGIAYLTQELESEIGVSITASHNPFDDNGVKFFTKNGEKISEAMEEKIEALMDEGIQSVNPDQLGKARRLDEAQERYIRFCLNTVPKNFNFRKLKIVLDCAHGATYQVAPKVFKALGIQTVVINNQPDGLNINLNASNSEKLVLVLLILFSFRDAKKFEHFLATKFSNLSLSVNNSDGVTSISLNKISDSLRTTLPLMIFLSSVI